MSKKQTTYDPPTEFDVPSFPLICYDCKCVGLAPDKAGTAVVFRSCGKHSSNNDPESPRYVKLGAEKMLFAANEVVVGQIVLGLKRMAQDAKRFRLISKWIRQG